MRNDIILSPPQIPSTHTAECINRCGKSLSSLELSKVFFLRWVDPPQKTWRLCHHISMLMHFLVRHKQYPSFLQKKSPILRFHFEIYKLEVLNYISKQPLYRDSHRAHSLIKIYHLWGEYHFSKRGLEVHP